MCSSDLVLVAALASGAFWTALSAFTVAWPLVALAAGYVVVASAFLAAVYGRGEPTPRQEASAWIASWALAVVLWWSVLLAGPDDAVNGAGALGAGLLLATGCFLVWQLGALALRQLPSRPPAGR